MSAMLALQLFLFLMMLISFFAFVVERELDEKTLTYHFKPRNSAGFGIAAIFFYGAFFSLATYFRIVS